MRFRAVPDAIRDALAEPAVQAALPGATLTAIRDVHGKVRVVVEGAPAGDDRERSLARLREALQNRLGTWLGAETPVWCADGHGPPVDALLAELHAQRQAPPGWPANAKLVERYVAKRGWLLGIPHDPPWPTGEADAGRAPHILTFFSHKGGVGRTTLLAAVAIAAARRGRRVMALDLDLEAPGLGTLFGVAPAEGVVEILLDEAPDAADVQNAVGIVQDPDVIGNGQPIRVLSAGAVDRAYLEALGRLDFQTSTGHGGMLARLRALLHAIRAAYEDLDFILIDARAGFHDLGGMMLGGLTHGAVLVATNSAQSWAGVDAVGQVLAEPWRRGSEADPVPLMVVHSMAPEATAPGAAEERERFRSELYRRLSDVYYPMPALPAESDRDAAHDAVAVPWKSELRGLGGPIDGPMAAVLTDRAFAPVVARIEAWFPRPGGKP